MRAHDVERETCILSKRKKKQKRSITWQHDNEKKKSFPNPTQFFVHTLSADG